MTAPLAYTDLGDPALRPVLYLHGNPGSRTEVDRPGYRAAFAAFGLRVITIDRPGFGASLRPRSPGHAPLAGEVARLLDELGVDRAVAVGHSRGALPTLALAALIPDRVPAVGLYGATGLPDDPALLAPLPPQAKAMLTLVKRAPGAARSLMRANARLDRRFPGGAVGRMAQVVPAAADRALLAEDGRARLDAITVGMQRNPGFAVDDWRSWLVDPLGFDPSAVDAPVLVWTGSGDMTCPPAWAEHLAARVPGARLRILPGGGHLHTPADLTELMERTVEAAAEG